jgi:hypothetical protein
VLVQNLNTVVKLTTSGKETWRIKLSELLGEGSISTSTRVFIDRTGKTLFANYDLNESLPGTDVAIGTLVAVDLANKSRKTLSSAKISVASFWLTPENEAIFYAGCVPSKNPHGPPVICNVYRYDLLAAKSELWVKGSMAPTTSR